MTVELHMGDCLEVMHSIEDGSVDMILADLPYGTTACKWDTVIDLPSLWKHYKRVIKRNGAIVLTASQPFTSALVMSNPSMFKYCWAWDKCLASGALNAPYQPLKAHEDVCVFSWAASTHSPNGTMTYNPQMARGEPYDKRKTNFAPVKQIYRSAVLPSKGINTTGERYPTSVLRITNADRNKVHPTQKPVALMEYLIRTYTNEGETVLDNTMGSGTTGVACVNTGRDFIGIEQDEGYFQIATQRIERARNAPKQAELIGA